MLGLTAQLDKQPIDTSTRDGLRRLSSLIDNYLALTEPKNGSMTTGQKSADSIDATQQAVTKKSGSGYTMNEWIEQAWEFLGEPDTGATGSLLLQAAEHLGYVSPAVHPQSAFTTSVRQHAGFEACGKEVRAVLYRKKAKRNTPLDVNHKTLPFGVGDKVTHENYGVGTVAHIDLTGQEILVSVMFSAPFNGRNFTGGYDAIVYTLKIFNEPAGDAFTADAELDDLFADE